MILAMKFNPMYLIVLTLMVGAITFSCEKTEDTPETTDIEDTANDLTALEDLTANIEADLDDIEETGGEPCVVVTVMPDDGSFPRTVTYDFRDGCVNKNGRDRRGIIQVVYSDSVRLPGSTRTVTFQDFFIDDAQITGTKVLTNESATAGRLTAINRNVDLTITFPDNTTASWKQDQMYSIIEGGDTRTIFDDVFQYSASATGTNREGQSFSTEITEPLVRQRICPWIQSGIRTFSVGDGTASIDYGDGACDQFATLTDQDGASREIRIRVWWK